MTDHKKTDHMPQAGTGALSDAALETLFAEARSAAPEMDGALFAAILGDAEAVQAERAQKAVPTAAPQSRWRQRWADLWQGLGGGVGASGLAMAALVGVGIGLNPPAALSTLEAAVFGSGDVYMLDYLPDLSGELIDG